MKVLIVEDEKIAANRLEKIIAEIDPEAIILDKIDSVKQSVEWFMNNPLPDLVFMDIQLGDGLSFDIFEKVEIKAPVVFTTAYDEYAVKAFKVNSIDYLLKPIVVEEVVRAFNKYKNLYASKQDHVMINYEMLEKIFQKPSKSFKTRFLVKIGDKIQAISVDDIAFFCSREKATFLHLKKNQHFIVDYSLEQLEQLVDPSMFYRINRQYLVSVDAIKDIYIFSNSRLKIYLKDFPADDIILSREKVHDFKSWLDR